MKMMMIMMMIMENGIVLLLKSRDISAVTVGHKVLSSGLGLTLPTHCP